MTVVNIKSNRYAVSEPLYQWDTNQKLQIFGLSLPTAPEIHFTNQSMDTVIFRQSTMDAAGVITVDVPNSILQKPHKITVYVCYENGDTFKTLYTMAIPVEPRVKPTDYVVDETEEEVYTFAEVLDIRRGADGTVYDSAGNAVRGQIINLKNQISDIRNQIFDIGDQNNVHILSGELPDAMTWYKAHSMIGFGTQDYSEPVILIDSGRMYRVDYSYAEIDVDNYAESATWKEFDYAKPSDIPKVNSTYGIKMNNGSLQINAATESAVKLAMNQYFPIVPSTLGYGVGCHGVARLSAMPAAAGKYLNWIVLYIGETDGTYTKNKFYTCVNDNGYKWVEFTLAGIQSKLTASTSYGTMIDEFNYIAVYPAAESTIKEGTHAYQPVAVKNFGYGVGCNGIVRLSNIPTAASKYLGWIVLYTGETDATYTNNSLYTCVNDGGYKWIDFSLSQIGDIETALDSIIAIQNSLIGGAAE